jgi:hypothetical protein
MSKEELKERIKEKKLEEESDLDPSLFMPHFYAPIIRQKINSDIKHRMSKTWG